MLPERQARVLAGIDEAGLGPMLGPLAMGLVALEFPTPIAESAPVDLWQWLSPAVAERASRGEDRLVIADSKQVFQRSVRGWERLEASALAWLTQRPEQPWDWNRWRVPGSPRLRAPWFEELPSLLPQGERRLAINEQRERLLAALQGHGLRAHPAHIALMPARDLNASFQATDSKAATTWQITVGLLARLMDQHGPSGVWAIVDRQGGRKNYGRLLERDFPGCGVTTLGEGRLRSDYHVYGAQGDLWVSFRVGAEAQSLPTAAASCCAKYGRELAMAAFNAYFGQRMPGLRPTAGYVSDARRWLRDAQPHLDACLQDAQISRRDLVRER